MIIRCVLGSLLLALSLACFADEPGAEQLYIVHFQAGENWVEGVPPQEQVGFAGHSANLKRLREEGVIRFGARYAELGVLIFSAENREMLLALLREDPGVSAGIFSFEVELLRVFYPWKNRPPRI